MGNSCYINSVLQAVFHVPAAVAVLEGHVGAGCAVGCARCLLRRTNTARLEGRADKDIMLEWRTSTAVCQSQDHEQESALEFAQNLLQGLDEARLGLSVEHGAHGVCA